MQDRSRFGPIRLIVELQLAKGPLQFSAISARRFLPRAQRPLVVLFEGQEPAGHGAEAAFHLVLARAFPSSFPSQGLGGSRDLSLQGLFFDLAAGDGIPVGGVNAFALPFAQQPPLLAKFQQRVKWAHKRGGQRNDQPVADPARATPAGTAWAGGSPLLR